jgi:NAD(P)-dependent dehydrogenase (short-subunit alcohol dehydrogenase family)
MQLQGKTALVTGAAQRLGREFALALARAGADVAITYRTSRREAEQTREEIARLGRKALAVACDVREPEAIQSAVNQALAALGGLDILINNAAIFESVPFDEITPEQWVNAMQTNARGPYLVTQAALASLRERRGRVVNIGSLGGMKAWSSHAHYCASKAALHSLTLSMAKALAPQVSVNCVAPGMIDLGGPHRSSVLESTREKTPMQRNGTAADVVAAVMFFATAPPFITGQIMTVDGGLSLST